MIDYMERIKCFKSESQWSWQSEFALVNTLTANYCFFLCFSYLASDQLIILKFTRYVNFGLDVGSNERLREFIYKWHQIWIFKFVTIKYLLKSCYLFLLLNFEVYSDSWTTRLSPKWRLRSKIIPMKDVKQIRNNEQK